MSYKALLFCPDEKTARTVTQVLSELDFQVEPCNEPFASVKKLTTEHFDAIVVDCENEQNATLLFKSARNSGSNQASLSIAVVEGQAGVAKAFRIGANLVLTKPINVEQSKGTIRVARGLLRKSESAKAPATAPAADHSASRSAASIRPPVPEVSAPTPSSVFELEQEPEPRPEATEAAFLESIPDPSADLGRTAGVPTSETSPFQPISKPMATALQSAAEATGQTESAVPQEAGKPSFGTSVSALGAAAAPARQKSPATEEFVPPEIEAPTFSSSIGSSRSAETGGSTKKIIIAAVVLLAAAVVGYMGWQKTHYRFLLDLLRKPVRQTQTLHAPQPSVPAAPSATTAPEQTAILSGTPAETASDVSATTAPSNPEAPAMNVAPAAPKPKKSAATIASSDEEASASKDKASVEPEEPSAIVVRGGSVKPVPQPAAPESPEPAPAALNVASGSNSQAVPELVNAPASAPHPAPQTLKVSQGVSQGLLVKKVPPVYPEQAIQMRIQGAVQIMATISKDGDITNLKVLSGDPLLAHAALDAVKQWKYKAYYLDGQPVDIQTQITVNFTLP